MVRITKINESFGCIISDDYGLILDAHEEFSFFVPGYRFQPKFVSGRWDGKIKLVKATGEFPLGLAPKIAEYFTTRGDSISIDQDVTDSFVNNVKDDELESFFQTFKFFSKQKEIIPRPDQLYALFRSIKMKRSVSICPTSFGKSLTIFMQSLYHIANNRTILIVVPTVALVDQFYSDIRDYCTDTDGNLLPWFPKIQKIYAGMSKIIDRKTNICISTWQSIYDLDESFVNQFDCIVLDECIHPDTNISLVGGGHKKIRDVVTGDKVLSFNHDTNEIEDDIVVKVHRNISRGEKVYRITLDDGEILRITGNHVVYTTTGSKKVEDLTLEDVLISI